MIEYHVHIRSTDQFKQAGVRGKNDRNKINGVDDQYFWLRIRITFSSSIIIFFGLAAGWFVPTFFEILNSSPDERPLLLKGHKRVTLQ